MSRKNDRVLENDIITQANTFWPNVFDSKLKQLKLLIIDGEVLFSFKEGAVTNVVLPSSLHQRVVNEVLFAIGSVAVKQNLPTNVRLLTIDCKDPDLPIVPA